MANSILYSEISIVCILVLTLLSVKVKKSMFLQSQRNWFFLEAISNVAFFALDSVWIFVNNSVLSITIPINWMLNASYYILSGLLGLFWLGYSETVQQSKFTIDKRYRILAYVPVGILFFMTLISLKTGWLFYIDDANIYHRGPAYAIQLLTSYGYIIFTAAKALYNSYHTDNYQKKRELRTLFIFVIPTLIAGTCQVLFPGFPILCVGNTFGILYVYLTLQEQLVSVDPLTKLNNRNQLMQYLSMKFSHIHERKNLYLLIMDVDYFKSINDKYGHVEGDRALQTIAESMMKACGNNHYFLSRYGGDEFIVICELEQEESVDDVCNQIHKKLSETNTPYELTLSIGYAKYVPEIKTQQEFIARADKELYRVKQGRTGKRAS